MSATNATTNYSFPLFIGTDKPAWLVDWNSAMTDIDSAIKAVDTDVQGAIVDISGLSSTVASHTSSISTISGQITVITTNLNTATGNINTINSLIGNGTPTTTDQTIIGAINELHADDGTIISKINNKYMIRGEDIITGVVADGVKTVSALLDELFSTFQSALTSFPNGVAVQPLFMTIPGFADCKFDDITALNNSSVLSLLTVSTVGYNPTAARIFVQSANIKASGSETMGVYINTTDGTIDTPSSIDSVVPAVGASFNIVGNILDIVTF